MKIYINDNFEIKAINSTEDVSLKEVVISEGSMLNNMSEFMILNHSCKPTNGSCSIYPNIDPILLKLFDVQENKINTLETVNNTQEETIATISYELMMMQTTTTVELKVGGHSPKFNMIRIWYNKGFWTESMVTDAVEHKWLTQEEANEILGV